MFSTLGDTMSTTGDTMISVGEYHEYTRGCSVHWGFHIKSIIFGELPSPTFIMISPGVLNTPSVLMISPSVLMISPQCTHDTLQCTETPWCTEDTPVYCTDIMQGVYIWCKLDNAKNAYCCFYTLRDVFSLLLVKILEN